MPLVYNMGVAYIPTVMWRLDASSNKLRYCINNSLNVFMHYVLNMKTLKIRTCKWFVRVRVSHLKKKILQYMDVMEFVYIQNLLSFVSPFIIIWMSIWCCWNFLIFVCIAKLELQKKNWDPMGVMDDTWHRIKRCLDQFSDFRFTSMWCFPYIVMQLNDNHHCNE